MKKEIGERKIKKQKKDCRTKTERLRKSNGKGKTGKEKTKIERNTGREQGAIHWKNTNNNK